MRISDWSSDVCSSDLAGGKEAACDESGVQVCSGKGQAGGEAAAFAQRLVAAAGFERRLKGSVGLFLWGLALLLIPVPRCRRLVVGPAPLDAPLDLGRAIQGAAEDVAEGLAGDQRGAAGEDVGRSD